MSGSCDPECAHNWLREPVPSITVQSGIPPSTYPERSIHTPLRYPNREIRLIEFLPGHGEQLKCRLSVHDLNNLDHAYVAISYVWGQPGHDREILLDGGIVTVRYNCWFALRQMRMHPLRTTGRRLFWCDSICINQDDDVEKSAQICLMGQIYSRAMYVAVCIGEVDEDFTNYLSLSEAGDNSVRATKIIEELDQREYFHRLWTVQECVLAKHIIIFCGTHIMKLYDWEARRGNGMYHGRHLDGRIFNTKESYTIPPPYTQESRPMGLAASIVDFSGRSCSVLHDKLYAFLSMEAEEYQVERWRINVDYSKSLWEMLLEYATKMAMRIPSSELKTRPVTLESIVVLARQLAVDDAFIEDMHRFFRQRIERSCALVPPTHMDENNSCIRLRARTVGRLLTTDQETIPAHEEAAIRESSSLRVLLEDLDFDRLYSNPDDFNLKDLVLTAWTSHPPHKALVTPHDTSSQPLFMFVHGNAQPGDIIIQITDLFKTFLICRENGWASMEIVGAATHYLFDPIHQDWEIDYNDREDGSWRVVLDPHDFLSFALLRGCLASFLCMPFSTSSIVEEQPCD